MPLVAHVVAFVPSFFFFFNVLSFFKAIVSPENPAGKAIAQALAVTEPLPAIRIVSSNAKAKSAGDKVQRYRYAGNDEFSEAVRAGAGLLAVKWPYSLRLVGVSCPSSSHTYQYTPWLTVRFAAARTAPRPLPCRCKDPTPKKTCSTTCRSLFQGS